MRGLTNISNVHTEHGETELALDSGLRALAIGEHLDDPKGLATLLLGLSNIYEQKEELETALNMRMKALDLFERLGSHKGQGTALLGAGNLYRKDGSTSPCNPCS